MYRCIIDLCTISRRANKKKNAEIFSYLIIQGLVITEMIPLQWQILYHSTMMFLMNWLWIIICWLFLINPIWHHNESNLTKSFRLHTDRCVRKWLKTRVFKTHMPCTRDFPCCQKITLNFTIFKVYGSYGLYIQPDITLNY